MPTSRRFPLRPTAETCPGGLLCPCLFCSLHCPKCQRGLRLGSHLPTGTGLCDDLHVPAPGSLFSQGRPQGGWHRLLLHQRCQALFGETGHPCEQGHRGLTGYLSSPLLHHLCPASAQSLPSPLTPFRPRVQQNQHPLCRLGLPLRVT